MMPRETSNDLLMNGVAYSNVAEKVYTDESVFSYVCNRKGQMSSFMFNGKRLSDTGNLKNDGLPAFWLKALEVLLDGKSEQDLELIKSDAPVEWMSEVFFQGEVFRFNISKLPIDIGNGDKILLTTIKNSATTQAHSDEVAIRRMLFNLVADNMSDVFCVFDLNGKPIFISSSIEKLTGYTSAELFQMPMSEVLRPVSYGVLKSVWDKFSGIVEKSEIKREALKSELFELEFERKDKILCWAEVSAALFCDEHGKTRGIHCLIRDITERKEEQETMHHTLQHEIELSMVKSKYISTISHEFRTPLSIIYSNLQLLENHRFQLDEETIGDAFELSRMAVKSLLRVLDKVTVIDAVNKNKLEFKPSSVNLPDVCHRIVKDLNEMEMYPDRIELMIDAIPDEVYIDESLFNHIFINLLHNALNFSDKKKKIQFKVSLIDRREALFVISDNGIGIPEEEFGYIFEPFYRASNSRNARGSGLGLAVVSDCLRLHNGKISFESKVGEGSVFKVILPIIPEG